MTDAGRTAAAERVPEDGDAAGFMRDFLFSAAAFRCASVVVRICGIFVISSPAAVPWPGPRAKTNVIAPHR
jgi:hypothetical protein